MRLLYIANQRLPTEKAYGIQIAKMCESFAFQRDANMQMHTNDANNTEVELVIPRRINPIKQDIFEYYGVKKNFKVKRLFSLDFYLPGKLDKIAVLIKNFISALALSIYALFHKADTIYSRDELPLYFLNFFKKNLIFEAHKFSSHRLWFYRRFKKTDLKIITISKGLKDEFIKFGFNPQNIMVAHDGVDLSEFNQEMPRNRARGKFGLPLDKKLIGYVGALKTMGMEKGIRTAIESLMFLEDDAILVLVGGSVRDIEFYKKFSYNLDLNRRIVFIGQVRHQLAPAYLRAFDVVIAPFPDSEHFRVFMSPLKLFEYMAADRPIVASDLPSIREVLNEGNSILVKPDDAKALAGGIKKALKDIALSDRISQTALEKVKNFTWHKRADNILGFINSGSGCVGGRD